MSIFANLQGGLAQVLLPIALGLLGFILVAGIPMLDFQNIAWLGGNLDPAQHYLGWALFRNGPWTIPFGLNPFNGIEFSNSIVFSDSLPLFAFLFKPFNHFLPEVFQYFGLWTLICFILQAWFAWRLIGLVSDSILIRLFGAGLFVFSPPMLMRVGLWTSLASHFLILAALYLNFRSVQHHRIFYWTLLVGASSLIHFYLLVMVLALWIAGLLDAWLVRKETTLVECIIELISILLTLVFCMWQAGYFSIGSSSGAAFGYGSFRLNLLAPIDARGWSYLFPKAPMQIDLGNGFNYFGLGILGLILIALIGRIKFQAQLPAFMKIQKHLFLYLCFISLFVFAVTNTVAIGSWKYTFTIPESLLGFASFLRASGRMFWPVLYFIFFVSIVYVIQSYSRKVATLILGVFFAVQLIDTSAGWWPIHQSLSSKVTSVNETPLINPAWKNFGMHYQKIVRFPLESGGESWEYFASFASINKKPTSSVFLARLDEDKLKVGNQKIDKQLRSGHLDTSALYVLGPWKQNPDPIKLDPKRDVLAKIDGFTVLAPGWKSCVSCPPIDPFLELKGYIPVIEAGEMIYFSRDSFGLREFMLDGWAPYGEGWGNWTEGEVSSLILPLPSNGKAKELVFNMRAFVIPKHPQQDIAILINGEFYKTLSLRRFDGNLLKIPLSKSWADENYIKIQFFMFNPASPKSFDINNDKRVLGIGLISAVFN
jgi:hypothetical protein